jgi:hypothetical protein
MNNMIKFSTLLLLLTLAICNDKLNLAFKSFTLNFDKSDEEVHSDDKTAVTIKGLHSCYTQESTLGCDLMVEVETRDGVDYPSYGVKVSIVALTLVPSQGGLFK